jgi:hypothetical protein
LFWDINEQKKKIVPATIPELLKIYTAHDRNWTNLLLERAAK